MNRPYSAHSPYSLTPTERIGVLTEDHGADGFGARYDADYPNLDEYADYAPAGPEYDEERIDRRWMWIAGIAGAILFVAVATTGIVLGGADSGSVSATSTSGAPTTSAAAATRPAPPVAHWMTR